MRRIPGTTSYDMRGGGFGASFEDCGRYGLGAQVLRQLGGRDLFWQSLVPFQHIGLEADLPDQIFDGGGHPSFGHQNAPALAEQLELARVNGVKLIYSFLNAFGVSTQRRQPSWNFSPAPDVSLRPLTFNHSRDPRTSAHSPCSTTIPYAVQNWSAEHIDASVTLGGTTSFFPVVTAGGGLPPKSLEQLPTFATWHHSTLDLSCDYKRIYVGLIAEVVGDLLYQVWDEWSQAYPNSRIDEVIEAIEIFNELDQKVVYYDENGAYDPDLSAYYLGETYGRVAYALRGALDNIPGGENVRLMLPSVTNYHRGRGASNTWESRRDFARGVARYAATYLVDVKLVDVVDLPEYFQGIDLHFYHVQRGESAHIAMLPLEVEELRQAIWDGIQDGAPSAADYAEVVTCFQEEFPISVMENGTSAYDGNLVVDFPSFVSRGPLPIPS